MTVEQKQCLLKYLNYYSGAVDGDWGKKSKEATEDFQNAEGLKADGVFGDATLKAAISAVANGRFKTTNNNKHETSGDFWDEIKYFDKSEFACKCNRKYCDGYPAEPKEKLIKVADKVRENLGGAATVSSGVRCSKHNANVGGVSNSRHLSGKAMDFCVAGKTANQVLAEVNKHSEIRYAYAIDDRYVHMDIE